MRAPLDPTGAPSEVVTLRMTAAQRDKLRALGGAAWARAQIDAVLTCGHTVTQGRPGEKGSWCVQCGEKIYDVDERECKDCAFSRHSAHRWTCIKHLMGVTPDMHVTFKISDGSCWKMK